MKLCFSKKNENCFGKVVEDLENLHSLSPEKITYVLTKGGCYDLAAKKLRFAVEQGCEIDRDSLFSILGSYSSSGRHREAIELLNYIQEHSCGFRPFIAEALVVIHCKSGKLDAALDEYYKNNNLHDFRGVYDSLIKSCVENQLFSEASQIFSDMKLHAVEPSGDVYRTMAFTYCKMGFPETAHYLLEQAEAKGLPLQDSLICTNLVESYGKVKQLEKAESVVGRLRQRLGMLDRKVLNSLLQVYATNGCYEKARAVFNTMMRDGPSPNVDTINCLLQALITDGRLNELYVVIQDSQDMGFKISKSSIMLMQRQARCQTKTSHMKQFFFVANEHMKWMGSVS